MAKYLVLKRTNEDRIYMPGEVVDDIPGVQILLERGYITVVPDDYAPPSSPDGAASDDDLEETTGSEGNVTGSPTPPPAPPSPEEDDELSAAAEILGLSLEDFEALSPEEAQERVDALEGEDKVRWDALMAPDEEEAD